MNRIVCFFKNYFPVFLFGIILIVVFLPLYREGRTIAGGEGSYFFDFLTLLNNYGYSWSNAGTGIIAISLNFGYVFHLVFLQKLFSDERIVNFVMIYSLYFLPFLAVYLLSLKLKLKPWIAFLIATFYVINPFTANFLKSINQWNMLAAYILPAFLWLILKFYDNSRKLFFFFGIHSLFFAFTNANPPTMVLYQIAIILFIIFVSLYKENKINLKAMLGKYLLILSSFMLFNMWWILNWFSILPDVQQSYTKAFAISWLEGAKIFNPAFWRVFTLTGLIQYPINSQYDYFTKYYSYSITSVLLLIPMAILIISLLMKKVFKTYHSFLMLMLLVIGFLSKGVDGPFGGIYEFLVRYLPFFSIFKSADEKWGILFIFLLTLYLILFLKDIKKEKFYRLILTLIIVYVGYNLVPFITSNFIPDYKFNQNVAGSRKFLDKVEYRDLRRELNNDQEQYRVLSLPGSLNYQVALQIEGNRFYTGNDPVLSNTNKSFIAPYNGTFTQTFGVLFDKISHPDYLKLLGLYNIKKIVINKDMYPWFGFREKENIPQLERIFDEKLKSDKNSVIDFYDVGDYYLPRFYIPKKIIFSPNLTQDDFSDLTSLDDWDIRSGIYIGGVNNGLKERADKIIVKAELENAVTEEKLGISLPEVSLPYVHNKPEGMMYRFILMNEQFDKWKVRNEPEKLFEKHLFYASKRISELINFEIKDTGQVNILLENYKQEFESAIGKTNDIDKLKAYLRTHRKIVAESNLDIKIKDKARDIFDNLEDKIVGLEPKQDYSRLVYKINIPKKGNYEVLVKNNPGVINWTKLEEKNLDEGEQELNLPFSGMSENLVDENLRIKDYSPNSIYRISFDYEATQSGSFFIDEVKTGKTAETQLFSTGDKFRNFEMFFKASPEATSAAVLFSNTKENNVQVQQILQPTLMLRGNKPQTSDLKSQTPKITFVEINPTKYRVKVEGAVDPYTLVFSESFHQDWKAYISSQPTANSQQQYGETVASYFDGDIKEGTHKNIFLDKNTFETWGKKPLSEDKHLMVNGYANSWYITPEDVGGKQDYELIIEYVPQRLFYIGLAISGVTVVGCSLYFMWLWVRRKKLGLIQDV